MREGWEYKKLGEVCDSITDGSHNPPKGIKHSEYRMISSKNINDDELKIDDNNVRFLSKENHELEDKRTKLKKDVVLLTIVGTIGRSCVLNGDEGFLTLQRSVAAIHPCSNILSRYLMHCLIGNRNKLEQEAHGIAQKGIYLKQLSILTIPVPSLSTQHSIVSELDKINELISLKKEQLKDYDNLAQSIFYDMFGDPVANDKGWDQKRIGDICVDKKDIKRASKCFNGSHDIQYIDISSIDNSSNCVTGATSFSFEDAPSRAQQKVENGDILVSLVRPNLKNIAIVNLEGTNLVASSGFCILRAAKSSNYFIKALVLTPHFTQYLINRVSGANYPAVREDDIKNCLIGVPPLPLQQAFAKRIEAIEQQKQLISSEIKDLETLLASRMQYWFD